MWRAEKDKIRINPEWLELSGFIALGPDVENPAELKSNTLQQFRLAQVWDEWAVSDAIFAGDLPPPLPWRSRGLRACLLLSALGSSGSTPGRTH